MTTTEQTLPPNAEAAADLKAYAAAMLRPDGHWTCARIEKKWGLYGETPEFVSTELADIAARSAEAPLWAIQIEGPDDIYAMPKETAAQEQADILNAAFERGGMEVRAKVVPWPHSAEAHAQDMRDNLRETQGHDY